MSSNEKGELKNTKLLRSAAMALVLSAGPRDFRPRRDTPKQGGTHRRHLQGRHGDARPRHRLRLAEWSMINSIFSRLVDYKFGTTEIVPSLADSWTISPDGLIYTFKLNPKAKFTNGRKVTAADVKYSIERAVNPKTQGPRRRLLSFDRRPGQMADGGGDDHVRHRDAAMNPRQVYTDHPTRPSSTCWR